ncbi:acyl-CoA dehydrogenase family protein [Cupriavidus necator]|uniref:acyl-CoA dehydrogenase family protein n=1 Tax=Cupriavidus necator TaxID=106590 RepID=UPI0005B4DF49|nr:acyl-CoA dehydrogenase family protein [Cupriavidus necator]
MNFNLDSGQQLLQDSVRRFVERSYSFDSRTTQLKSGSGGNEHWRTFASNGWLAAALPEDHDGLGGTLLDTALICHELGRGLVVEPYLGCAVLAAQTLVAAARPAQLARLVPHLADGSRSFALAYSEAQSRGFPEPVALRAEASVDGYALHGTKTLVLGGTVADTFIVSATLVPQPVGQSSTTLFLVDAGTPGLTVHPLRLHDGSAAAELVFDGVQVGPAAVLGEPGQGAAALRHGLEHAITALCAELVGVMERAIELTAEYLKIRKQFGVPIGSFQALQHRMADMAADLELSRSMLYALLASLANDDEAARGHTLSQAKALIGRAAKEVCGQAIQLHGGIGMTEEYAVGHYLKRAVVADVLFGNSDRHEAACAATLQASLTPGEDLP